MERRRPTAEKKRRGYFPSAASSQVFCIPSGCGALDGVLGGGFPLGRVTNVVGDRSSGKTLLAIEACGNFAALVPKGKGKLYYRESEAAFDEEYARSLGVPIDRINFGPQGLDTVWDTVEDIFEDLEKRLDYCIAHDLPAIYIIDSLDALTSRAELKRDIDQGSYGADKAKKLSELFRRLIRKIKRSRMAVIVVSQVRDKIGVMFGERHTRTGGRALDFYASIIVWLHHIKTLSRTVNGIKQAKGVRILAKTKKNKIAPPFRQCQMDIRFGWGIEDLPASLEWLRQAKALDRVGIHGRSFDKWLARVAKAPRSERAHEARRVRDAVLATWRDMAKRGVPRETKY